MARNIVKRFSLARDGQMLLSLLAVVIGVVVGFAVFGFLEMISLFQGWFYGADDESTFLEAVRALTWWQRVLIPTTGGLFIGLLIRFIIPDRRNHGIADVMEACALRGGRMSGRTGLGAIFAAVGSIGVGASVGREGPAVHMGATISALIAKRFSLSRNYSITLIGCGVAAAVAASFNAPIAGVFFSLEVVVGHYTLFAFAPIVIASVTATVITRIFVGDSPAFFVPDYVINSFLEVPAFVLLGIVCAAIAVVFMRAIFLTQDLWGRTRVPAWGQTTIGGALIGTISIWFPEILGVGYPATDLALKELLPLFILVSLIVAKTVATAIALGSGFAGGVFSPSLFLGAMTGGAFGIVATMIFPEYGSAAGAYSVTGMAGVAAAVLGAPISTILIVFELTSDYKLTIAVMIVATVATVLTHEFAPHHSFFKWQLARRSINLDTTGEDEELLMATTLEKYISQDFSMVTGKISLDELRRQLASEHPGVFILVDDQQMFEGYLTPQQVLTTAYNNEVKNKILGEVVNKDIELMLPNSSMGHALQTMAAQSLEFLPVVIDIQEPKVIGVVFHKDLIVAHNRLLTGK